jgi:hypothetical protein
VCRLPEDGGVPSKDMGINNESIFSCVTWAYVGFINLQLVTRHGINSVK